jgi:subtilisin family serine protease
LRSRGVSYQSFWINNSVYVPGASPALVEALAARPDVAYVRADRPLPLQLPAGRASGEASRAAEWGILKINADDVWATGNTGQGVAVANIDTGVRYTHEALVAHYRGNLGGGTFDHDYNWWDPDGAAPAPVDDNGHGTHTMGTIVGGDGPGPQVNDIGVAPGATWITAQGCDGASCSDVDLISAAQWMLCPTRVDGSDPDCSRAPHVINNSWGGMGGDAWYQSYINAWLAAGIVTVFPVGSSGPSCNTVGSPADYPNVIAVGATDENDVLASFSSRGPGTFRWLKPDAVAPGINVRSASPSSDSSYVIYSGTSMAVPHTVGTLALMLSASPDTTPGLLYRALALGAVRNLGRPGGPDSCGGRPWNQFPNPIYGFGRVDAARAVALIDR